MVRRSYSPGRLGKALARVNRLFDRVAAVRYHSPGLQPGGLSACLWGCCMVQELFSPEQGLARPVPVALNPLSMFSDFPNLHALVVHFPLVLLLVAAALQAVLVFKDWQQVRWIALVAMAGGLAGGIAASTTFHAMPRGLPPKAAAIFAIHEQYAGYTLWLAGITLLLAGVGEYFQIRRRAYAVLVLVPALAAAGAVSWTGHHGAQLVYVEGVGPKGNMVMSEEEEAREEKAGMEGMDMGSSKDDKKAGAEEKTPVSDSAAGEKSPAEMKNMKGMEGMQGMEMSGETTSEPAKDQNKPNKATSGMGNMDMSEKPASGNKRPAQERSSMADMPGMKTKKEMPKNMDMKGMDMKGMDMQATPSPRAKHNMSAMPGMDMNKGMGKKPSGAKKQPPMKGMSGMEGMPGMDNMPGMKDAGQGQPAAKSDMGAMKGMPGMDKGQTMPSMSMPNPMDKYRFEDNNPAREKPKKDN